MERGKPSRWKRVLRLLVLTALGLGAVLAYQIWSYRDVRDESTADAAIVMGAAVWGSEPSPAFAERIEHAIDLYQRGRVGQIVFTGGVGEGTRVSEAEVAKRHAVERGVRPEHIHVEMLSRTSRENLERAKGIVDAQHFGRVMIVSAPLHMKRAMTIAESVGLDARPSPTPEGPRDGQWRAAWMLARETFFLAQFFAEHYADQLLGGPSQDQTTARAAW